MAYTPPAGDLIQFEIGGAYTPAAGDDLSLRIGEGVCNPEPASFGFGVSVSDGAVFQGPIPGGLGLQVAVSGVLVHKTRIALVDSLGLGVQVAAVPVTFTPVFSVEPHGLGLVAGISSGAVFSGAIPENFTVQVGIEPVCVDQIHVARGRDLAFTVGISASVLSLKPDYELPTGVVGGMGFRFRKAQEKQAETAIRFERSAENNRKIEAGWLKPALVFINVF